MNSHVFQFIELSMYWTIKLCFNMDKIDKFYNVTMGSSMKSQQLFKWIGSIFTVVLVLNSLSVCAQAAQDGSKIPPVVDRTVDFEQDIQPIFAQNCVSCHGSTLQMSSLRLDEESRLKEGGVSGPAIIPGKSADSLLIQVVSGVAENIAPMPMDGEPLSDEQIGLLRAWIDQGAKWSESEPKVKEESTNKETTEEETEDVEAPEDKETKTSGGVHWAFSPRKDPEVPEVKQASWIRNEIDAFVLAKLEEKGLKPSKPADKQTLIRRLHLDLLGLPPTPDEIEVFVNDNSEDAYENLVDRLLASPHFGERWGRHWLDLARYADSDGYEKDTPRPYAWRYRDWVINAINEDMPYDEFTIKQLAGDLLPEADDSDLLATGFHRNTLTNKEGGVDQEEFRIKAVKDRVNTTGTVWMGITVGCAECHTHKYDPITQEEYYGLFAFFNKAEEKDVKVPLAGEEKRYLAAKERFDQVHDKFEEALEAYKEVELPERQREWERKWKPSNVKWQVLKPFKLQTENGVALKLHEDGSIQAEGSKPDADVYILSVKTNLSDLTALRLEVLPVDEDSGPGRAGHGNFVLSEFSAWLRFDGFDIASQKVEFHNPTVDYAQDKYPIKDAIDGDLKTGWAISGETERPHVAVFETKPFSDLYGDVTLTIKLSQQYGKEHTLERFRLLATDAERPVKSDGVPFHIANIIETKRDKRTDKEQKELAAFYSHIDPELALYKRSVDEHAKRQPAKPDSYIMAMAKNPEPPTSHIHIRGDFLRKGKVVKPHTPEFLPPLEPEGDEVDRLDLASWILDPEHPLTARVAANRVWQHLFGRGIVESPNDFGTRSKPPSHPLLLDWLANRYIELDWSRKALIKLIVMSATYRQSSESNSKLQEIDPQNLYLARQSRFRLPAEIIRDNSLAVSGLLYDKLGGPSIRPPLPEGVADLGYANSVRWSESPAPDRYRRGLYIFFQRTVPYPMLMTFDSPDANVTCTRRERSNTPLQSLALLNDPVFFDCAQWLGKRIVENVEGGLERRIDYAFRLCLGREPSTIERARLIQLYAELTQHFEKNPEEARSISGGNVPEQADAKQTAAWIALGRTLINLDEFMTRE